MLQESLVAMFAWYRNSSLTLVYLFHPRRKKILSVGASGIPGVCYCRSTPKDWKPYLGLILSNHQESPILSKIKWRSHRCRQSVRWPPTLGPGRLQLLGIISPVTDVRVSGLDAQTYDVTTCLFGELKIRADIKLDTTSELCLVHPWIRPLLDQEFSRVPADATT